MVKEKAAEIFKAGLDYKAILQTENRKLQHSFKTNHFLVVHLNMGKEGINQGSRLDTYGNSGGTDQIHSSGGIIC